MLCEPYRLMMFLNSSYFKTFNSSIFACQIFFETFPILFFIFWKIIPNMNLRYDSQVGIINSCMLLHDQSQVDVFRNRLSGYPMRLVHFNVFLKDISCPTGILPSRVGYIFVSFFYPCYS